MRRTTRAVTALVMAAGLGLAGCGGDDETTVPDQDDPPEIVVDPEEATPTEAT